MLESAWRTHTCGEPRSDHIGSSVRLQGWAGGVRDLGGVTFIDLRDRHGFVQITCDERSPDSARAVAAGVRLEYVVEVEGDIVARSRPNPNVPTGAVEVVARSVRIVSKTPPLPFTIQEEISAHEDVRLTYRYLDLRRPNLARNFKVRHQVALAVRSYLDGEGFLEVETPILTKATPEGARDYLVPSRVHPGQFYALPQSPQIFKQILMVAGFDRYFQIVKCFRDEDLRADRQPEFTQIDIEMSFATRELVVELCSGVVKMLWKKVRGFEIGDIPRITYDEAMRRFGVDAPDMRFGLEHEVLTDTVSGTEFRVLSSALDAGGIVKGFRVPGAAGSTSRKVLDSWTEFVRRYRLGGLLFAKVNEDGWTGPLSKLSDDEKQAVGAQLGAEVGDLLLVGAGPEAAVNAGLGRLRAHVAKQRDMVSSDSFAFCWVTDFPAFEWDEDTERWVAVHHPFTAPRPDHLDLLGSGNEEKILTDAYDLVCNGYEIAGGSIRIHDPGVQSRVFEALGLSEDEAQEKFGFLLDALRHGAPPHGGAAFGFDRMIMLLCGTDNIRDVIAFPKTTSAQDLMSSAPSRVPDDQLEEVHVSVRRKGAES